MKYQLNQAILATAAGAGLLMLSACGGDKPAESASKPQAQEVTSKPTDGMKTYRVATLFAFPPFAQDDAKGSAEGFDMDIINHIAETKGFRVTYHLQSWSGILEGLNTNKHDIVAAGVVMTPEREALYDFTDTYMDTGWMLVLKDKTADGKPNYSNFSEAVRGSKVFTTEYGAAGQDELEAIVKNHGSATMMDSGTPYLEISNVIQGKADAAYDNSRVMQYYIFKNSTDPKTKTYGIMDPNAQTSHFAFAVKKGNDELLNQLNEGLREMKANGKYDELRAKWFGE